VERGSDKHGPQLDDELVHETRSLEQGAPLEARVEEFREQEGAGDDQPEPQPRLTDDRPVAAPPDDPDDAEARRRQRF
jgi:hypothetical protein